LVAAEGEHKLPSINGSENLKEALQKLGSILSSKLLVRSVIVPSHFQMLLVLFFFTRFFYNYLQAVEVLWTPQNENDTLSELELLEYYPLLLPL
jgi:uncharacterized membrane protein